MSLLSVLPKVNAPETSVPAASGLPPWADTALFGSTEDLRKLLDSGLDPNARAPGGTSVLMMSVDSPEKVRLLIERRADVNAKAPSGANALIAAAGLNGNSESVRLLVDAGADVNHSAAGATPLGVAVTTDDTEKIATLIAHGADPNGRLIHAGLGAFYPLQIAVGAGNPDIVRLLIAKGARIDGHLGIWRGALPPLATAVEGGQTEMVKLLILLGADVNQRDLFGMTPLLWAAISDYGGTDTVDLLLKAGADASARDKSGADALALARKYELHHVARALGGVQPKESR
jgi:ankyrin repeat protein